MKTALNHMTTPNLGYAEFLDLAARLGCVGVEVRNDIARPLFDGMHPAEAGTLADSVARHVRRYFELHGADLPPPGVYQRILREIEAPLIDIALEYTGGNQARCADLLGINRNTLRKKTNELDIRVTRRRKLM